MCNFRHKNKNQKVTRRHKNYHISKTILKKNPTTSYIIL